MPGTRDHMCNAGGGRGYEISSKAVSENGGVDTKREKRDEREKNLKGKR